VVTISSSEVRSGVGIDAPNPLIHPRLLTVAMIAM
jgi:hypothetical protein